MYNQALKHFKSADPVLYGAGFKLKIGNLAVHPDPFLRLTRAIVGQQLSVKAASTIFGRFEKLFKKGINPKEILKLDDETIRGCGISYPKIKYLKDLAQKIIDKEVVLENLQNETEEVVVAELTKIKGIGIWSSEMFLMFSLGRPDIFSFGDLGLQNAIQKLYKLKDKPTIEQMERLTKKWIPYRTYAAMILWRSLDNEPE